MELTQSQKENIDAIVCNNMDDLEDVINVSLKGLLERINKKLTDNLEALTYARQIFFKG